MFRFDFRKIEFMTVSISAPFEARSLRTSLRCEWSSPSAFSWSLAPTVSRKGPEKSYQCEWSPQTLLYPVLLKLTNQVVMQWSLHQLVSIKSCAISFFSSVPFSHWSFTMAGTWRSDLFFFGAIMRLMRILAAFCNSSWSNQGCWVAMLV